MDVAYLGAVAGVGVGAGPGAPALILFLLAETALSVWVSGGIAICVRAGCHHRRVDTAGSNYFRRAGSRCISPGKAWLAVSRMLIVALLDSGVTSGLTSMTAVPRDSARSASPAAG